MMLLVEKENNLSTKVFIVMQSYFFQTFLFQKIYENWYIIFFMFNIIILIYFNS